MTELLTLLWSTVNSAELILLIILTVYIYVSRAFLSHDVYPGAYLQLCFKVSFIDFQPQTIYAKAVANQDSKTHNTTILMYSLVIPANEHFSKSDIHPSCDHQFKLNAQNVHLLLNLKLLMTLKYTSWGAGYIRLP